MTPPTITTLVRGTAALERVATLSLSAHLADTRGIDVAVQPRSLCGSPVHGSVPVDLYATGPGAAALPGGEAATLPQTGTTARRLRGVARGGWWTTRLDPTQEEVTLTALVPPPHPRPVVQWPVTSLRLPFAGSATRPYGETGGVRSVGDAPVWTVVTFNAHFGTPPGGGFDPARGRDLLAGLQPDVALLQEMDDNRRRSRGVDLTARWASELGMAGVYGPNLIDASELDSSRPAWFGNAILTTGRVVAARNLALPWIAVPGCFTEPRGLLTAVIETPSGQHTAHGTHLDLNAGERILQVGAIRTALREADGVTDVLGGDLNTTPGCPDFRLFTGARGCYDAWAAEGEGQGFTHPAGEPRRRIDVLFPSERLRTARIEVAPVVASDHLAVRAVLVSR